MFSTNGRLKNYYKEVGSSTTKDLYVFSCSNCGTVEKVVNIIFGEKPICSKCGAQGSITKEVSK